LAIFAYSYDAVQTLLNPLQAKNNCTMFQFRFVLLCLLAYILFTCKEAPDRAMPDKPEMLPSAAAPDWAKAANIYEVNVRQYSSEGTFAAFAEHLPRLQAMGVDILWFMPIHPISEARRKGTLGSYYAVADYRGINPHFGDLEGFKALVQQIHDRGMRIILDWVPNHTGWDHAWIEAHPEYYLKDSAGNIIDPINSETGETWGWTDVAALDYRQPALREAMISEMLFWLEEVGVDGFRCDVASEVPDDFWAQAIPRLRQGKPDLFMLAESNHPPHRNEEWFAMTYNWPLHHLMNKIAQGQRPPAAIDEVLAEQQQAYQRGYSMQFLTNHDENSWNGTIKERLGAATDAMAVLAFTVEGMPLLYSGQEAGLDKRLEFFEKDQIEWGDFPKQAFYTSLLALKHRNAALWNGSAGGRLVRVAADNPAIYAYRRVKGEQEVAVVLNLSAAPQEFTLGGHAPAGAFREVFSGDLIEWAKGQALELAPWGYWLLER
jgi:alpha-amylase